MTHPSIALFGARGEMGRYILTPLLDRHAALAAVDVDSTAEEKRRALTADCLILSVPRDAVSGIVNALRFQPTQLIIEICSSKKDLPAVLACTGAAVLSLHPMNGPHTPWAQQKWVIVGDVPAHPLAQWFLKLLREKQVLFHAIRSAEEHDLLLSLILGLPEMMTVFMFHFLEQFRSDSGQHVRMEDLLKVTSPAFASLVSTYIHTVCSSAPWLRKQLLTDIHPQFLQTCRNVFQSLLEEQFDRIDPFLQKQLERIHEIQAPDEFIPTIRQHVTEDFNFMNAIFLRGGLTSKTDLYVQKLCTRESLLPGNKLSRIGIHGIQGSFTDEAWRRFSSELLGMREDEYELAELVHSANVLRAVHTGEVDAGIFAFANSGSGGYLASIEAMGEYDYRLLALFTMPINMCILTHPSIESVHQLEAFFGHPVALSQCRKTLAQRWPDIPVEAATDAMDTALSAKLLREGKISPTKGIFASKRAAELYGLRLLVEGVHHDPNNATAFAVVRKK
ncbi:prephenate dehydrogenase/arogenate dehydrogenase family protein [Candidatus Peregrinibacteria bacterium]|nr:prephenate dehydrogenase/arogenate dehydrogenase family protein [Candidatus Peregrinibacteria bacterium]